MNTWVKTSLLLLGVAFLSGAVAILSSSEHPLTDLSSYIGLVTFFVGALLLLINVMKEM